MRIRKGLWWSFGLVALISVAYFLLRIWNLTLQPIFADEAIYIRWAQIMQAEPTLRFVSVSDGKTPLFMWLMIPFFKVFSDPLLAGRVLSVLAGFGTMLGAMALGWKFIRREVGLVAGFLVAVVPYQIFFDRMALVDSMLACMSVWSVFFLMSLVRSPRFDLAIVSGVSLGLGILVKTPGYFNVVMAPIVLLSYKFSDFRWRKFLKVLFLVFLSMGIAWFIYNLLRLGPGFDSLSSRNSDYVFGFDRLLKSPLDPFLPRVSEVFDWFVKLLSWPVILLWILGIVFAISKRNWVVIVLIIWSLVPLLIQTEFLKSYTTRYILSSIVFILIVSGYGLFEINEKLKLKNYLGVWVGLILVVGFCLKTDLAILKAPETANLPIESKRGYFEDWTAGYGLREIASVINEESKMRKIVVGTEGSFGTLPDGIWIYFDKNPNVVVVGGAPDSYKNLMESASEVKTYFIANRSRVKSDPPGLKLLATYPKLKGDIPQDATIFYEIVGGK